MDDYKDFCLAYAFTSRDFSGTLGVAWIASPSGSVGGICEKPVSIQGETKSLNTGIVTNRNQNVRVPEVVNRLTFAHEVGHSIGAVHDSRSCVPNSAQFGNYIMYSRATSGTLLFNSRYSTCSLENMNAVLASLTSASSTKNCFRAVNSNICGNGIVESGEECDYGGDQNCCSTECRLKSTSQCSPSQGSCCTNTCQFQVNNITCLSGTDCKNDIFCTGNRADCPVEDSRFYKPNLTPCNSNTQVCQNGICTGSICEVYGMQQCFLSGDESTQCSLACNGSELF